MVMRRILPALLLYGAGMLVVAELGGPVLDAIAAVTAAAVGSASTAVARLLAATTAETLVAVLAPLTLLAIASVVGVVVWPAIVDHVPADDVEPQPAEVVQLDGRRPRGDVRRAA